MGAATGSSDAHRLDGLTPSQRALLRILCWVAMADGDFAAEERQLLERLTARLLQLDAGAGEAAAANLVHELALEPLAVQELDALVAALDAADGRQLAVKLALQMVSVNQRPDDRDLINPAEKQAYRRLIEALALPEAEVQEAEWAARQELARKPSLLDVLGSALERFGAWPPADQIDPRLPMGYWL